MSHSVPPKPLRVIFAGTPEFARVALARLHSAGHTLALVLTQPDRPAGRGMQLQSSAVKKQALAFGLPVLQPRSLRLDGKYPQDAALAQHAILEARADVMVVAAYGLLLPQWVLDATQGQKLGCLNIHASLLPRWRGAAPIHRAIEAGDAETGVTIMQMDAGLDTGDMLLMQRIAIGDGDTTALLHDKLADVGGELIVRALQQASTGSLVPRPQSPDGVTYAHKIEKSEGALDWAQSAAVLCRRIRALDPFPGASSSLYTTAAAAQGDALKIWSAEVPPSCAAPQTPHALAAPGEVVHVDGAGIDVATGDGCLRLLQLQRPGGKRLPAAEFLKGFAIQAGMRFAFLKSAPLS